MKNTLNDLNNYLVATAIINNADVAIQAIKMKESGITENMKLPKMLEV